MDLESECSALESVEDNEAISPEGLANVEGNRVENNGSWDGECGDNKLLAGMKAQEVVVSPPLISRSPAGSVGLSPPSTTKGYGLKKWRRIRREFNNDGNCNVDTNKLLKRGLSTSTVNSTRPQGSAVGTRQKNDGPLSSLNAIAKGIGAAGDGFAFHGPSMDSRLATVPNFAAGTDSENSEDHSSKSSTAASFPKLRHDMNAVGGCNRDRNRMRSLSLKNVVNTVQQGQQGKNHIETSKKPRGGRVKIEKENSHSSMESDSRSSNFVFMQGTSSATSNGGQNGRSTNYDGESSDEAQGGEQHSSEELPTGDSKENAGEFENLSLEDLVADLCWEAVEENVENHGSSTDLDPLVESIFTLQSAQEALEKEVQKLREIGNKQSSLFDGSTEGSSSQSEFASGDPEIHEASSSDRLHPGEISSHFMEKQVISLKQSVNLLESELEEANAVLQAKEAKVVELESALKSNKSPKEETRSTIESQQIKYREEMEAKLEGLFKQKIEAEVEYLAISRTIQKLRVASVDQVAFSEERKTLGLEESKGKIAKRQAEKLEKSDGRIVDTDQVLKLQKKACKVTTCFCIQVVLLFTVFVLYFLELSPHYVGVVPT